MATCKNCGGHAFFNRMGAVICLRCDLGRENSEEGKKVEN